jgi:hypothetical protein
MTKTFIPERPWGDGTMGKVDVDDAFAAGRTDWGRLRRWVPGGGHLRRDSRVSDQ